MVKEQKMNNQEIEFVKLSENVSKSDISTIEEIYNDAFPEKEKLGTLEELINKTKSDNRIYLYIMYANPLENGQKQVVGFSYHLIEKEFIYCVFIAIKKEFRSKGYGNKFLNFFKQKLTECMNYIFLVEMVEDNAANKEQRIRRRSFYSKLGFFEAEKDIEFNGVHFDLFALKKISEEQIEDYLEIVEDALLSNSA